MSEELGEECICTIEKMMAYGCKCGRIDRERAKDEKERQEIIKKKRKALNEGVSYEERCKQFGTISEF